MKSSVHNLAYQVDQLWMCILHCMRSFSSIILALCLSAGVANASNNDLESSYRFLVSDHELQGGALYTATAGKLKGSKLPLSFSETAEYWGEYVCKRRDSCAVFDVYDPFKYTITPPQTSAGALQAERVNVHGGTNIYDAATWQIAVMLGHTINRFSTLNGQDAYALVNGENSLLRLGYNGNAQEPLQNAIRATTKDETFLYNDHVIGSPDQAYAFRMIPRSWISVDPFVGTQYESLITMTKLIKEEPNYRLGNITWTDWKPVTGENAWAFLLGPLQAAYVHFFKSMHYQYIPFKDLSVQNAISILPTFASMQSRIGGVYYAPEGTLGNQGDKKVNPHHVSVENNVSLYAGLKILSFTLRAELAQEKSLGDADKVRIKNALEIIRVMIEGGKIADNNPTEGLLAFFKTRAWQGNEFVQAGLANDPKEKDAWVPLTKPKAIDVNTWGIAALGAKQIDQWFGFGASYKNWQQVKKWGAYGVSNTLWGVGYSDEDGNGMNADGSYRQGVLSSEWTAGAVNMVRNLVAYYQQVSVDSANYKKAQEYVQSLKKDEFRMSDALQTLRIDNYNKANLPGKPAAYQKLINQTSKPYLYASKRYFVPFGWYANPLPSTCATSWMIMLADRFDPFGYGGQAN